MATKQQRDGSPAVKAARRKVPSSQSSRIFALSEFVVTSVTSERFLPSEKARRGRFELDVQFKVGSIKSSNGRSVSALKAKLQITLTGFTLNHDEEGNDIAGDKSFTITAAAEARFEINEPMRIGESPTAHEIKWMSQCIYPLAVSKLQIYAADMGYRNVSPSLMILDYLVIPDDDE
ncbi:hypothetical protein [Burkholderia cenocepacia]|uniref:hypothetical protein n=1 Tax=Burkholderia cenocepacia TaxID=95486 RepID=UPI000F599F0B|nr:hypothetical protein [Burkholderia cenocepacia]